MKVLRHTPAGCTLLLALALSLLAAGAAWGRTAPFADADCSAIYHLDGTPEDGNGILPDLALSGGAGFTGDNLGWMEVPAGAALHFSGLDAQAELVFTPAPLLPPDRSAEEIDEVSIEGMFYFSAFPPRSGDLLEILHLRHSWTSGMDIRRSGWTDKLAVYLGNQGDSGERVNSALAPNRWLHIKMIHNRTLYLFYVNGEEILKVAHGREDLNLYDRDDEIRLVLGDFIGWADEIRLVLDFDSDDDGIADRADPDDDNDGVLDEDDAFPLDPTEWLDTDHDGEGDNADPDADNDGIPDEWEERFGLDPLAAADGLADTDGDGYSNLEEYLAGSLPREPASTQETAMPPSGPLPALNRTQHAALDRLITMQEPGEVRVHPVDAHWLRLSLVPERNENNTAFLRMPVSREDAENPLLFSVVAPDGTVLPVDRSGLKRRTFYAPLRVNDLRIGEHIFLHLVHPLSASTTYTLRVDPGLTGSPISASFRYEPENDLSDLLHVDPYGYRSADRKKAYLGLMMGSAGELEPSPEFEVVRTVDNQVVYRGVGTLEESSGWRSTFVPQPYQRVYQLDFTPVTEPGEYYLRHASGISQPFPIHPNVHRATLNTLALGMYHQRRGEPLTSAYTRFTHGATVEDQTYVYDSNDLDPFLLDLIGSAENIRYPTTLEGQHVDISGGHMDAGDYSPYTWNSAQTVWLLITTLDLFGQRVAHDNLGLPESGDGIPDLLQEALLEINWLKDMQDPVDGGVFSMSKPKGMNYQSTMPGETEGLHRYLAPKDTPVTGAYAAALARAARSPLVRAHDPELAALLGQRAARAWDWLEAHPGMHGYHHYGRGDAREGDEGHEHARAWAAIELYALTGESRYHDAFVRYHKPLLRDNGVYLMNRGYGYTTRTLVLWDHDRIGYPVEASLKQQSIDRFREAVDGYVADAGRTPYDLIVNNVVKRWQTVGWFFPLSSFGWDLLLAHELYRNIEYLETLQDQLHFTLGANPGNMSSITGMGYRRLRSIVDQESRFDGIEPPVTGLPISPMVTGYTWNNVYERNVSAYTWPPDNPDTEVEGPAYGLLEMAHDGWNINGEFTIEHLAGMLCVLAALTPPSAAQYPRPACTLETERRENGVFRPVLTFSGTPPSSYTILWSENDRYVSSDPAHLVHQDFADPVWKLGAEIITPEGRRWYAQTRINTRDYTNTAIPLAPFADDSASSLFHLDNTTEDARGIMAPLHLEGSASFADNNLYWMEHPAGAALQFSGPGDQAVVTFFMDDYLPPGGRYTDVAEVAIEGLFSIDELGPPDRVLDLFYLRQSWGNGMQLTRYTWTDHIRADLGKTQNSGPGIDQALAPHRWHFIRMVRSRDHYILQIDGRELVRREHDGGEKLFDHREIELKFGNFSGWADEIRFLVDFDTDHDGMPDRWEERHGLDPGDDRDAQADPDHDFATNLQEYRAGSDPHDPASRPLRGDLDGDGTADLADAVRALEVLAGHDITPGNRINGDVNGDMATGMAEAVHILRTTGRDD